MPTTFQKFLSGRGIALGVLPLFPVLYLMTLVAKYTILVSVNLWFLLRKTVRASVGQSLVLPFLVNLLLFSPVQVENWMWGFQFRRLIADASVARNAANLLDSMGLMRPRLLRTTEIAKLNVISARHTEDSAFDDFYPTRTTNPS